MPNWVEGTLKVRGEKEHLKAFVLNGLKPVDIFGAEKTPLVLNEYGDLNYKGACWIEGTSRGFVENLDVHLSDIEYGGIIHLDAKFAWCINTVELQNACKKYGVDMRIYGFELGMEFNQEIEIIDGEITMDNAIKFDDYSWECPCPNIGG